ncbi:Mitochondrial N(5)-glutamine methyltransferase MTQ1 [Candida viswanathii]|uniref:Mitochondrial N(5)-glutamine methyltransferase MTQ1 n=1 Tax=Candida viswanathii TaxID=5486 RepID=A0A367YAE4_9ASCO|nr:Mitochondrial N(5)-glutamine methyltransferase MTQ1 [Candida viswanathii]
MPRITAKLIRQARKISPLLPPLLPANRTIERASLELKWIKDELPSYEWADAVLQRQKLVPLQYILKSQPFGELSIICKKGVLIPRWETEEWCLKLTEALKQVARQDELLILDACTGTGCIPLLIAHELREYVPQIHAFDVSGKAYDLANENLESYKEKYPENKVNLTYHLGDVYDGEIISKLDIPRVDLVTSNPPYIPLEDYVRSAEQDGVEKSVRLHEPKLALVGDGDFYYALIQNILLLTEAEGFVFEVGYRDQADFVCEEVQKNLQSWKVGIMMDGALKVRCVVGWKSGGRFDIFNKLCDYIYD